MLLALFFVFVRSDLFRMSDAQVERFRLMRLFSVSRLPKQHFYVRAKRAAPEWAIPATAATSADDDVSDIDENATSTDEELAEEPSLEDTSSKKNTPTETAKPQIEAKRPKLVIARMRSGVE